MNITELARKLKITPNELREKLPELGFDIGMRAIQIPDEQAQMVIEKWQGVKRRERLRVEISVKKEEKFQEEKKEDAKKIIIPPVITVHNLAKKLFLPVTKVISELLKNGVMATINDNLDFEIAAIIAEGLGFQSEKGEAEEKIVSLKEKLEEISRKQDKKKIVSRPPIIVVLGHVDHGKTSLLDAIRKTDVAATEAGAITQHIGAYQVEVTSKEYGKRALTFIDTPGHEAFNEMRSRGGQIADLAILVIAADDRVQPQTIESIKVIQEANLPFIVALNKIDLPEADLERIKKGLSEVNLIPEDWGGKVICVPVSAKTKEGLNNLLEMLLLLADLEKEKYLVNATRPAVGIIIESHLEKGLGSVATVLVYVGTLKVRDSVVVGPTFGRIKFMKDYRGTSIKEAGPGMPAQIIGLKDIPLVGVLLEVIGDVKDFKKKTKEIGYKTKRELVVKTKKKEKEEIVLKIILRVDVVGSAEAIVESLKKLEGEQGEVKISILKKDLGDITESDIVLAQTTSAWLVGFHVDVSPMATKITEERGIKIYLFQVIYDLVEEAKRQINQLVPAEIIEKPLGKAKVLLVFRKTGQEMIIGAKMLEGSVVKKTKFRLWRNSELFDVGGIIQLQINKQDIDEVKDGAEFGLRLTCKTAVQVDDELEIYQEEKKERKLFE